jgi:hypothetical protein
MSSHADPVRSAAPDAYFVLDDDDRVVHVSREFHTTRGLGVGHVFWDHLPGALEVYGPHFAKARETGEPVEATIYYAGRLKRLLVIPGGDGLAVHVENLVELDVTSLATLTRSLEQLLAALADRASARPDRRSRASLQALP